MSASNTLDNPPFSLEMQMFGKTLAEVLRDSSLCGKWIDVEDSYRSSDLISEEFEIAGLLVAKMRDQKVTTGTIEKVLKVTRDILLCALLTAIWRLPTEATERISLDEGSLMQLSQWAMCDWEQFRTILQEILQMRQ